MTNEQALKLLAQHGLTGRDAETSLEAACKRAGGGVDDVIALARMNPFHLMRLFGADGMRAAMILRRYA